MTMISKTSTLPPFSPTQLSDESPQQLHSVLRERGCNACELGLQIDFIAPVVYRGNPGAGRMMIGEAPGLWEDQKGLPFVGKAGDKQEEIFQSVGWSSNKDWYIGNVCKCRPVAEKGSGKQNKTPTAGHRKACKPYIVHEIQTINPYLVLILGATAAKSLLPNQTKGKNMADLAGKTCFSYAFPDQTFFIMYHPAALLHAQRSPDKHQQLRELTWEHIQLLKQLDIDLRKDLGLD